MPPLPSRTLTEYDASAIRFLIAEGIQFEDIATLFQCNVGRISEINTGQKWPDIPPAKMGPTLRHYLGELFGRMSTRHARVFGSYLPPA